MNELTEQLAKTCGYNPTFGLGNRQIIQLGRASDELSAKGATPEALERFSQWWNNSIFYKRKAFPSPAQVSLMWPDFLANKCQCKTNEVTK
jgi:hypothetical protein